MKKYTLKQLKENYQAWTSAVIVFKQECFTEDYTEKQRSYKICSNENYFKSNVLDDSLYSLCLDDKKHALGNVQGIWLTTILSICENLEIDYCYITESNGFKIGDIVTIVGNSAIHEIMGFSKAFVIESLEFYCVSYCDHKYNCYLSVLYDAIKLSDEVTRIIDKSNFTKDDLKPGYVVELRNGNRCIVIPKIERDIECVAFTFEVKDDLCQTLHVYSDNLEWDSHEKSKRFDVMKVYGYSSVTSKCMTTDILSRKLIWERNE